MVTAVFNVPLNNRLASVEPHSPEMKILWTFYLSRWTVWNHVRTICCLLAGILFAIGMLI